MIVKKNCVEFLFLNEYLAGQMILLVSFVYNIKLFLNLCLSIYLRFVESVFLLLGQYF